MPFTTCGQPFEYHLSRQGQISLHYNLRMIILGIYFLFTGIESEFTIDRCTKFRYHNINNKDLSLVYNHL